jgi:hypothetical protein
MNAPQKRNIGEACFSGFSGQHFKSLLRLT